MKSSAIVTVLGLLVLGAEVHAANVLSVHDLEVESGAFELLLEIDLTSDRDLTRLRFDLDFDPAFCDRLEDQELIDLSASGRTFGDPDDTFEIVCADGSIRVDIRDELGGAAIPAGAGPIIEIDFGSVLAGASGAFTFTPTNVLARAGGSDVAVTVAAGTVTINPPAGSTTTTTTTPGATTTSGPTVTSTSTTGPPGTGPTTSTVPGASTTSTEPGATTTSTSTPGEPTTTTLPPPDACTATSEVRPSFVTLRCSLRALMAPADAALAATDLPPGLGRTLARAETALERAEARCADANTRRARSALRSMMRSLSSFRRRLGSLGSRTGIPDEVREPLQASASQVIFDARYLRNFLACPMP